MSLKPSLNWLLVFVPVSLVLRFVPSLHNETALFICSALAIIPLAGWMGRATEALAEEMGEGMGGFLNAAFGNAAELIIALLALSKGLTGVVKASITGSIIGNLLLVLGASIFAGGLKYPQQRFNQTAARTSSTSLFLAAIGLLIPTLFHKVSDAGAQWDPVIGQKLSLAIAIILFVTYGCGLLFSLKTHKQLFSSGASETPEHEASLGWSRKKSVLVLVIATVFVAIMSEFLVGSVEAARAKFGWSEMFVGVIVIAIVGNAAEHSTAVLMALKNKMDLSIGIAVGSSLQIALFVAPVLVFVSYFFGHPMNLEFSMAEVVAVIITVIVTSQIAGDGESNWLEGVQLLSVYLILGVLFYFLPH
ncbi:MAG: calcium/proton antiporter, CaCA family [Verrucomicrobiales bacterium]|nr:calcium/proton antiporter, CaCA family [Verrucomicrobiales bacterium]